CLDVVGLDRHRARGDPRRARDHPLPAVLDRLHAPVVEAEMRLVVHAVEALHDRLLELVHDLGALARRGVDAVDALVVHLHLEVLRPAAVAAQPGADGLLVGRALHPTDSMLRAVMGETRDPIGVVLAGGLGRRIGGAKATVELHGMPLIQYPVAVLQAVLAEVVVVAKQTSELPPLPGVPIWIEPAEPCHPLAGIVHALEGAGAAAGIEGMAREILVSAGDLPFLTPSLVE